MSIVKKLIAACKSLIQKTKPCPYPFLVPLVLIFYLPAMDGIAADHVPLKEITVVSDDNYPPFIFRDVKGHLQGILVDEWRLWEEKTGIKVVLRGMDWDKAQKMMAEGNTHVIDTIFFTEERAKTLAFSAPYASIDVPIFFHSNITGITDINSLHGFTIGVKAGDACIDFLKGHGIHTLLEYPSYESIVRDAAEQKIKVFCIDAPPARYYLYKMNLEQQYRYTAPLYTGQFHRAVKKERMDVLTAVEKGFAAISRKEHERIEKKWRGSPIIPPCFLTYFSWLMGGVVILGTLLLLWNHTLRRKVVQKTVQLQEAVDRLEKSEDQYRNLFENANEAIFVVQDGKLTFLNPMTSLMIGYSAEELMAKPYVGFIYPDDRDMVMGRHAIRLKGGEVPHRYSFRIIHKDGSIRWVELNAVLINWNGNLATLNFMDDITDRKRAEEELQAHRIQLSNAMEMAHLGHWEYDIASDLFTFNDNFYKIFRTTVEEVGGYTMHSAEYAHRFAHPDDMNLVEEETRKAIETTDPHFNRQTEHRILYSDGTVGYMTVRFFIVKDAQGRTVRTYGVNQDVTEQKRAEEALRESQRRLTDIIEFLPDATLVIDKDGRVIAWNRAIESMTGVRAEEMLHKGNYEYAIPFYGERKPILIDLALHPEMTEEKSYTAIRRAGDIVFGEAYTPALAPGNVHLSGTASVLRNSKGEIVGAIECIRNNTDRKNMEERLQRAEKMEALGLLAGGVAHDLNNALGILIGYSELLYDGLGASDPLREDVRKIMVGGERAAAIVQDLLTLARRGVQTKTVVNLNKVVTEYLKSPEYLKLISFHPTVRIKAELEGEILKIAGSTVHLSKTLMNLVSNAAEAMPSGGEVIVRTENRYLDRPVSGYDRVQEGDYVVLTVSDEGEGITDDDMKRIFEPFYTKKVMGRSGTGLGLAVVWGTVKDHGGYIDVRSARGKGTTFTLYFPVTRAEEEEDEVTTLGEYMGRGEKILVVDDMKDQRDLAGRILTKLNYRVETVASGEEAVEHLKAKEADLIVLDMIMDPGIDGFETYRQILQIRPNQKAVIVSGFAETDRVSMAQSLGAGPFVRKPYIKERIGLAVRKELDN